MHFRRFRSKKDQGAVVPPPAEKAQPEKSSSQEPIEKTPVTHLVSPLGEPGQAQSNGPATDIVRSPDSECKDVTLHPDVPEMDAELMELWAKIQDRVKDLARRENKPVNENMDIGEVLDNLDKKKPGKKDTVKKCFGNTLTVIKKVGGFVSDAASQVFAPAAQCYNAISFLIDAYEGYQGAFDGLGELFEECTDYLNRLPYYVEGKMDAKLLRLAAQQLDLFVRVCDAALSLRYSAGQKVKMAFKVMFLADDGVQPLLGEMAKLVNRERNLVSAQTFLSSRQAADAAREGLDTTKRVEGVITEMQAKEKEIDSENVIKQALGFAGQPATPWRIRYREYLNQRLPETGQWILNEPEFASWETGQSAANILAIEGGNGTGKSFLASAIIQHLLHKKSITDTGPRVSTAYYFFEGTARDAVKNASNLETAAKSVVWQFTQAERHYKKSVAKICAETQEIDPASISSELLFENPDLLDMNVLFYIVIDGLSGKMGEGMLRFLRRASALNVNQRVRVLLTVDSECSQQLATVDGVSLNSIPISSKSRTDVEIVIRSRMDSMIALSDRTRPGITELRARICDELYQATTGDYFRINLALDDISKREYISDITNALKNAGEGRAAQIKKEMEGLNQNCSETEISEINEIIIWIRRYREILTERQMTAALYAAVGELSLLTLADKIKEKYPLFKITNKGEITFRAPEVEESIPDKCGSPAQAEGQDGTEAVVSPGELAMVKHFLSTVCPQETYSKLEFEKFLESKKQSRSNRIYKNEPHIEEAKMALTCLRLLTGETEQPSADLLSYARSNFAQHLSAVNLALVDIEYKKLFGPHLIKLFMNPASIDIALNNDELPGPSTKQRQIGREFMLSDANAKLILRWLNDTAVMLEIGSEERDWVNGLVQVEGHRALLSPAAKLMAIHLVQKPHFLPLTLDAFRFITSFLKKFELNDNLHKVGSVEQIEQVEQWCKGVLKAQKDSLWHTQIGSILQIYRHKEEAQGRARQALEMDPKNWRASTLLSILIEPHDGLAILKPAADTLESSGKWKRSNLERVGLAKMLFILAELSWQEKQTDAAINFWIRAVEVDFTDYGRVIKCLQCFAKQEQWSDIITILRKVDEKSTDQLQGLAELIAAGGGKAFPHKTILRAALHSEQLEFIVSAYERSIQLVDERGERATLCNLRYHCGRAAHALQNGSSRAVQHWRQALEHADPYLLSLIISCIAPYYLQKAAMSGSDAEAVSTYLKEIETLLPEGVPEADVLISPRVYVARYHWKQGNKVQAKQIAREIVHLSLDILSDDDESNDLPAYNQLLSVFIAFGDMTHALATRALIALNFGGAQSVACDGECNRSWPVSEETQWCQDCIDAHFEKECAQKIELNALPFSVCNNTHQFLHAPQMDESAKLTSPRMVPVGDEVISFEDWLARIDKDYIQTKN
ncbi:uncharacterized protein N7483_011534 [Penicillium malachiteum]|uniref:uncharacterized protein n=1 Tax=Penicillium malachiteum TaxID=1324776 RepID=UPI002547CEF0|nr:uncharacterized protein N7483_011534 [Penicillium malachiteum]KAJ5714353.1 hypothetical protein N7483_011534 [Penicillium malachiteum]